MRNMSIPSTKPGSGPGIILVSSLKGDAIGSQTLERPTKQTVIVQGSHTLGKVKKSKTTSQRHSAGNIDYDNISQEADEPPTVTFRCRSKTVGDTAGKFKRCLALTSPVRIFSDGPKHDPGAKSEGEDDSQVSTSKKSGLGRTPNHLTLR